MSKRKQTVYLCSKCDREYFSMSRSDWDLDREGNNAKALIAKGKHKCPWEIRRERRKNK